MTPKKYGAELCMCVKCVFVSLMVTIVSSVELNAHANVRRLISRMQELDRACRHYCLDSGGCKKR